MKDFLSGVFMILEDQYSVGDVIDTGFGTGTVEEVALRVTQIRDTNGVVWYVRNGEIVRIGNRSQGWSLATVDLPVAYDEDLDAVRTVVARVGAAMVEEDDLRDKLLEPPLVAGVESVAGEAVVVRVTARTAPQQSVPVARDLRERLKVAFDEAGIRCRPRRTAGRHRAPDRFRVATRALAPVRRRIRVAWSSDDRSARTARQRRGRGTRGGGLAAQRDRDPRPGPQRPRGRRGARAHRERPAAAEWGGLMDGTIELRDDGVVWVPGEYARRFGFIEFRVPADEVVDIRVASRPSLRGAMDIDLTDDRTVVVRVPDPDRWRYALDRVAGA